MIWCNSKADSKVWMKEENNIQYIFKLYYALHFLQGIFIWRLLLMKTNHMTKIGVLAAAACILQFLGSIMGLKVAGFLEIEFSDLPAIIGALALGPVAGVLIELIKNVIHCTITSTGFVGEFANFVINGIFVFVIGAIYSHNKTKSTAIKALFAGTVVMTIMAAFTNLYVMLPLYMSGADFNIKLNLVLTTITPFNFARGLLLSIITIFIYKKISVVLHKY